MVVAQLAKRFDTRDPWFKSSHLQNFVIKCFKSTVEKSSIKRQCIAHLKEKTKNANLSALALTLTSVHNFEQMKIFRGENMTRFDMTRFGISDTTSNGDVLFSYIK